MTPIDEPRRELPVGEKAVVKLFLIAAEIDENGQQLRTHKVHIEDIDIVDQALEYAFREYTRISAGWFSAKLAQRKRFPKPVVKTPDDDPAGE